MIKKKLRLRTLADILVFLILALAKLGNIVIQLKCYLLGMFTGPEKISGELFFFFHFFQRLVI